MGPCFVGASFALDLVWKDSHLRCEPGSTLKRRYNDTYQCYDSHLLSLVVVSYISNRPQRDLGGYLGLCIVTAKALAVLHQEKEQGGWLRVERFFQG